MRKRRLSVVLLLVLVVIMTAVFAACNPTQPNDSGDLPNLNPGDPNDPGISESQTISSQKAWTMLKEAAFAAATKENDNRYISFDTSFILGFGKDGYESLFVMRVAAAIDNKAKQNGNDDSEMLIELRQFEKSALGAAAADTNELSRLTANGEGKLLAGFYYYEGKLVADVRGIKRAAGQKDEAVHVVWTVACFEIFTYSS